LTRIFPERCAWLIDNPLRALLIRPGTLRDRLAIGGDARVLEIGPGSGYVSRAIAAQLAGGTLHLVDVQVGMLRRARRRMRGPTRGEVMYECADVAALPFRERTFDAALAVAVLGETPDVRRSLRELHDVLRPGGRLLVHEHLPDPDFIPFVTLQELAGAVGFRLVRRWGSRWNYSSLWERPRMDVPTLPRRAVTC